MKIIKNLDQAKLVSIKPNQKKAHSLGNGLEKAVYRKGFFLLKCFLKRHLKQKDTKKLTIAPTAANKAVVTICSEVIFGTMLKNVPPIVPMASESFCIFNTLRRLRVLDGFVINGHLAD